MQRDKAITKQNKSNRITFSAIHLFGIWSKSRTPLGDEPHSLTWRRRIPPGPDYRPFFNCHDSNHVIVKLTPYVDVDEATTQLLEDID